MFRLRRVFPEPRRLDGTSEVEDCGVHAFGRGYLKHVLEEFEVPRLFAEASTYTEDFHGGPCCWGV